MAGYSTDDQLAGVGALIQQVPRDSYYAFATTWWYRLNVISKMRRKDPPKVASPQWCAVELLYHALNQDSDLADAVIVVSVAGGLSYGILADAVVPLPGRRILRLLYDWSTIEPSLGLPTRRISEDVLAKMAERGGVLRARVRQIRFDSGVNRLTI